MEAMALSSIRGGVRFPSSKSCVVVSEDSSPSCSYSFSSAASKKSKQSRTRKRILYSCSHSAPGPSPFTEKYHHPRTSGGPSRNSDIALATRAQGSIQVQDRHGPVYLSHSELDSNHLSNNLPQDAAAEDPREIAERLPELQEVLEMLRERAAKAAANGEARAGPGEVYLVGTGPGDPELLTLKAARLLQTADLVLYDRLVSNDILDLINPSARLLYVGKTSGYHSRTQEEIHELLLSFADMGATVVRLKGGDPLVFGRGGEEIDFLREQGITVQIVPGITAASGIAAELGIPLTQRGVANSVRFLTGHSRKGGEDPLFVASCAADPDSTLVVYMGLATLPGLVERLMANGLPAETPACAVERGTTPRQRTVFTTLSKLPKAVAEEGLVSPTLIIIGEAVALSHFWPREGGTTTMVGKQLPPSRQQNQGQRAWREGVQHKAEPRERSQRGADPALPSQR